jgi:hypothetical protein
LVDKFRTCGRGTATVSAARNFKPYAKIRLYLLAPKEGVVNVLEEGQTIRHEQYGIGTVTESNTERTTIEFDNHGLKKFVTSMWTAEVIGDSPVERPTRRRTRRKAAKKE